MLSQCSCLLAIVEGDGWTACSFAGKFYPARDERNFSVISWTVLSCKACENTLCLVGNESKSPFETRGCHFSKTTVSLSVNYTLFNHSLQIHKGSYMNQRVFVFSWTDPVNFFFLQLSQEAFRLISQWVSLSKIFYLMFIICDNIPIK